MVPQCALFIVDASQTAGLFPIDMGERSDDVPCFTGHKGLMGPQELADLPWHMRNIIYGLLYPEAAL